MNDGIVYVLHFDQPISPNHTAQHYIGYADNLSGRISHHRNGTGARLTQVARERGIGFEVVAVYSGTRDFERRLKNNFHGNKLCPYCNSGRNHPSIDGQKLEIKDFGNL